MPEKLSFAVQQGPKQVVVFVVLLTCLTMFAFAANSLLARLAFQTTAIDAVSYTVIRIISGAIVLSFILIMQRRRPVISLTTSFSAVFLFTYAAAFALAYREISTGAGALILFAAAQLTMISYGFVKGERASLIGLIVALGGLVLFLLPSASAPPYGAAVMMAISGMAWGCFSIIGKSDDAPIINTASSFLIAVPMSLIMLLLFHSQIQLDQLGAGYAIISGGLASGLGYAVWYWVKVRIATISAGSVQLSVPIISAILGVLILDEPIRLISSLAAILVLAGVAIVTLTAKRKK
ncbi:DMT family transporter [Shewanella sp. A32]|uniref:DMT family transporter n=1 Tax=Shewanella sp. A32 TaxID=3031327 RepID=UPI0023B8E331|nr:DMT family transporter [Shewanella sp. A32]MDF0534322.1 DMT family transporter [Shewanella sp. A32]